MKYELSGFVEHRIVSVTIPESQYREVKSARETCLFALEIEEKCALLIDNYYEFECELLKIAQASAIWPHREHSDSMLERLSLDRGIVNLLTACRLYADQTDHGISTLFGEHSIELANVKKLKNDLYDAHFGYRFMEALRNHVQHSGLVVHGISKGMSLVEGQLNGYYQYTVVPFTEVNALAINPGFKKTVLEELRAIKQPIDLRAPLREYVSCYVRLHEQIRQIMAARLQKDRHMYEATIKNFATVDGHTLNFPCLRVLSDGRTIVEECPLVTEFLGYHDLLRKKYSARSELKTTCASNSIQEKA